MANKKKSASKKKVKPFDPGELIDLIKGVDEYSYYSGQGANFTYERLGEYCCKNEDKVVNFLMEAMENKSNVLRKEEEINDLRMSLSNAEDELAALKKTRKMMGDY